MLVKTVLLHDQALAEVFADTDVNAGRVYGLSLVC